MQNQNASDVKQINRKNNRSQTEYPSATAEEEVTMAPMQNQKATN